MRRWEDVLPPEIAKEQTAWERRTQLLRLLESGVEKQELQTFAGNVSRVFLNQMFEAWLQDDAPFRELARRINAKARREAKQANEQ